MRAAMKKAEKRALKKRVWKDNGSWQLLLLCIPALLGYILFNYIPILVSILIPFKDYKFSVGILDSAWVGLKNFKWMLTATSMQRVIRNTVLYGIWFLVIGPVVNVLFALLLFEIKNRTRLKFYQTVITFPNFMSMVIVGYVTYAILSPQTGIMNSILTFFGKDPVDVYTNSAWWPAILTIVNLWKGVGMGSMMYFAALMGIDTTLYEAAELDGANKFQQFRYIILPSIKTIVTLNVILAITGSLSAFEQPFVITTGANGTGTYFVIMNEIAHVSQKVGLASAMAVVLLILIFIATILQKVIMNVLFRNANEEEEIKHKKRVKA